MTTWPALLSSLRPIRGGSTLERLRRQATSTSSIRLVLQLLHCLTIPSESWSGGGCGGGGPLRRPAQTSRSDAAAAGPPTCGVGQRPANRTNEEQARMRDRPDEALVG